MLLELWHSSWAALCQSLHLASSSPASPGETVHSQTCSCLLASAGDHQIWPNKHVYWRVTNNCACWYAIVNMSVDID